MAGGFYIDADEQRARARRMEARLLEYSENRRPRPRPSYDEDDDDPRRSLPPVFRKDGEIQTSRDTSLERRASRFRDGLPPPPMPVHPDEVPRLLPPQGMQLMDQALFDQGIVVPTASINTNHFAPSYPDQPVTPEPKLYPPPASTLVPSPLASPPISSPIPPQIPMDIQQEITLSESQKKRRRRKKNREERRLSSPAPYPLPVDVQSFPASTATVPKNWGPPSPTYPEMTQTACDAECLVQMPNGSVHRLRCPLKPFPHPGQPHLVELRDGGTSARGHTQIFMGFYLPGDD